MRARVAAGAGGGDRYSGTPRFAFEDARRLVRRVPRVSFRSRMRTVEVLPPGESRCGGARRVSRRSFRLNKVPRSRLADDDESMHVRRKRAFSLFCSRISDSSHSFRLIPSSHLVPARSIPSESTISISGIPSTIPSRSIRALFLGFGREFRAAGKDDFPLARTCTKSGFT